MRQGDGIRLAVAMLSIATAAFTIGYAFGADRLTSEGADERARRSAEFLIEACRQGAREVCK